MKIQLVKSWHTFWDNLLLKRSCLRRRTAVKRLSFWLKIRPMLLFRFAHEPLFIPWEAVAVMGLRRELFRYGTAMEITKPTGVHPLTLYGRPLAESLARHAPDRLLGPPPGYED